MSEPGRPPRPPRPWPDRVPLDPALTRRLNDEWRVTAGTAGSLKQRIARPFRRLFNVLMRPQETFNSTVVQHLNHLHEVNLVHADREESLQAMVEDLFHRTEILFDRIETLGLDISNARADLLDETTRQREGVMARARRIETAVTSFAAEHREMRTALGVLQQQTNQLAKGLATVGSRGSGIGDQGSGIRDQGSAPQRLPDPRSPIPESGHALSHKYVGFEDAFRGSAEAIREGLRQYVPLFRGASEVLDVGCGRGEFLALLAEAGVDAKGIDLNETMVDVCRGKGLQAMQADALGYLRAQPDASLGGLFAAQVVEHLEPGYLTHLLEAAFDKLRPGAPIVLETINPACWFAFFESYIRDITHERALHPDTLSFLLVASGFQQVEVRYSAPYPDHEKLQPIAVSSGLADSVETLNANVDKLNRLLFTYLDYAAVARRP